MNLDKNYKPPSGFEPVLDYRNSPNGEPIVDYGKLRLHDRDFVFDFTKKIAKLPLKASGKAWHTGWDIPTLWAIDSDNTAYCNDAHGGSLQVATANEFVGLFENEYEKNNAKIAIGLPPDELSWMKQARAAGWAPPKDSK